MCTIFNCSKVYLVVTSMIKSTDAIPNSLKAVIIFFMLF